MRERIGQRAEAERAYQDALAYNPHFAAARYHLAVLLHRLGQTDRVRLETETFIQEWRDADATAPDLVAARALSGSG